MKTKRSLHTERRKLIGLSVIVALFRAMRLWGANNHRRANRLMRPNNHKHPNSLMQPDSLMQPNNYRRSFNRKRMYGPRAGILVLTLSFTLFSLIPAPALSGALSGGSILSDDDDVAAAKLLVETAVTGAEAPQIEADSQDAAVAYVEDIISELDLNGVAFAITGIMFNPAAAGDEDNPFGANGIFFYTVELTKGAAAPQIVSAVLVIIATQYGGIEDDMDITLARMYIESSVAYFTVSQSTLNSQDDARAYVQNAILLMPVNGVEATINEISFEPAVAGTVDNQAGINGAYVFTLTLAKGLGKPQETIPLTLIINASNYDTSINDNADITAARQLIESAAGNLNIPQSTANTQTGAQTYMQSLTGIMPLNNVEALVNSIAFVAAVAGTLENPAGTDGVYTFTVTLSKGEGTPQTTLALDLIIEASPYDPSGGGNDDADITAARQSVESSVGLFTVSQATANTQDAVHAYVQNAIVLLPLNGVAAVINDVSFNPAVAGVAAAPAGTNGVYTFTVTLSKGAGTPQTTSALSLVITATPYDPSGGGNDDADITAARQSVENAVGLFTVSQSTANTQAAVHAYVQNAMVLLPLNGAEATITDVSFNPAVAGAAAAPAGTNGVYTFTVTLSKGAGTPQTTSALSLVITATPYDPSGGGSDDADITAARQTVENAVGLFTVSQSTANTQAAVHAYVQNAMVLLPLNGAEATISDVSFNPAVAGTAEAPAGIDGVYSFTVTLRKGTGAPQITSVLSLNIGATQYNPSGGGNNDDADITAARQSIESAAGFLTIAQSIAVTQVAASYYVQNAIGLMPLNGVTATITDVSFSPATAGTAEAPAGTSGSYTFTATLRKGSGAPQTTIALTIEITATPYNESGVDNDSDIATARSVVENVAGYIAVTQAKANTQSDARAHVQNIISRFPLNGVVFEITDVSFKQAVAGTIDAPAGIFGNYTYTVVLSKGAGVAQTTIPLELIITPTPHFKADAGKLDSGSLISQDGGGLQSDGWQSGGGAAYASQSGGQQSGGQQSGAYPADITADGVYKFDAALSAALAPIAGAVGAGGAAGGAGGTGGAAAAAGTAGTAGAGSAGGAAATQTQTQTQANARADFAAAAMQSSNNTLTQSAATGSQASVASYDQLKAALESPDITLISLADDIQMEIDKSVSISPLKSSLVIDGNSKFLYLAESTDNSYAIQLNPGGSYIGAIMFKNINIAGKGKKGLLQIADAPQNGDFAVIFENINFTGSEIIKASYCNILIKDSNLLVVPGHNDTMNYVVGGSNIALEGTVRIDKESPSGCRTLFNVANKGSLWVRNGADILINNRTDNPDPKKSGFVYFASSGGALTFESTSKFNYSGTGAFAYGQDISVVQVSGSANVNIEIDGNIYRNDGLISVNGCMLIDDGANFKIAAIGNANANPVLKFQNNAALVINSPREFLIYNASSAALNPGLAIYSPSSMNIIYNSIIKLEYWILSSSPHTNLPAPDSVWENPSGGDNGGSNSGVSGGFGIHASLSAGMPKTVSSKNYNGQIPWSMDTTALKDVNIIRATHQK